jgi:hypothetical protein
MRAGPHAAVGDGGTDGRLGFDRVMHPSAPWVRLS